jgi:hypothetical protein
MATYSAISICSLGCEWARILGLVIGFLALVRIPFGTALGIYTIWVLLLEQSGREYDQLCRVY